MKVNLKSFMNMKSFILKGGKGLVQLLKIPFIEGNSEQKELEAAGPLTSRWRTSSMHACMLLLSPHAPSPAVQDPSQVGAVHRENWFSPPHLHNQDPPQECLEACLPGDSKFCQVDNESKPCSKKDTDLYQTNSCENKMS